MRQTKLQNGFTIVELLIVIVVIAILAAISIIAYNGIQDRAQDARLMSDQTSVIKGAKMRLSESDSLTLPDYISTTKDVASYFNFESLEGKVDIAASNFHGLITASDGYSGDEDYPATKDRLFVAYGEDGPNDVFLYTARWSYQEKVYKIASIAIWSDGSLHEDSYDRVDCDATPDHDTCIAID